MRKWLSALFLLFACLTTRGSQSLVGIDLPLSAQGFTFGSNFMVEGGWYIRLGIGTNSRAVNIPITNGPGTYRLLSRTYSPFAAYTNTLLIGDAVVSSTPNGILWVGNNFTTTTGFTNIQLLLTNADTAVVQDWVVGGFLLATDTNYLVVDSTAIVNSRHFAASFARATTTNTSDIVSGNMLPNSSFELGLAHEWYWQRDTFITNSLTWLEDAVTTEDKVTGLRSFKLAQNAGNFQLISPPLRARDGLVFRPYTLTMSLRGFGSIPTVTATVQTTVPGVVGGITNSQTFTIGTPTTTWRRYTNVFYFAHNPTREFYLTIQHIGTGTNGVYVDDIELEEGTNASPWNAIAPVEVAIKTGRHGNLFLAGDTVALQLVTYNAHATNRVVTVATDVYDFDNALASNVVTTFSAPPGVSTNLIYPPRAVGPYRVQTRILGESDWRHTETSYAVAAFGPNSTVTAPNSNALLGSHIPSTRQAVLSNRVWGIDITRAFSTANMFRWSTIQPSSNTFNWNLTDVAVSNTFPTVAIYGAFGDIKGSPAWAMTSNVPRMDVLQAWASNVVTRYKDRVGWWELMNEPYAYSATSGTNVQEQMTTALVTGIKSADPNARISAGVMDTTNKWLSLYSALPPNIVTQIQDVAWHYYPSYVGSVGANMNSDESYDPVRVSAILARSQGYRPINSESGMWDYGVRHANSAWFTAGDYIWPHLEEEAYVRGHVFSTFAMLRQALRSAGNGMVYFHYYAALLGYNPTRPDTTPTIFENNDSLKNQGLAYYTAVNFVGKGTPLGPITNTASGANVEAYAFRGNDGRSYVTAWTLRPSTNYTITITNTAFEVRNVFGRQVQTNTAAVTVGMLPIYIISGTLATNTLIAEFAKSASTGAAAGPAPRLSIDFSAEGPVVRAPMIFKWTAASTTRVNYFTQPDQVLTRHRIQGIDSDWSPWSASRVRVVESMPPPGIYKIEVQTKDFVGAATNTVVGPTWFVNDAGNARVDLLRTP